MARVEITAPPFSLQHIPVHEKGRWTALLLSPFPLFSSLPEVTFSREAACPQDQGHGEGAERHASPRNAWQPPPAALRTLKPAQRLERGKRGSSRPAVTVTVTVTVTAALLEKVRVVIRVGKECGKRSYSGGRMKQTGQARTRAPTPHKLVLDTPA